MNLGWKKTAVVLRTMVGADAPPATALAAALVVTAAAPLVAGMPVAARRWLWAGAGLVAIAALSIVLVGRRMA